MGLIDAVTSILPSTGVVSSIVTKPRVIVIGAGVSGLACAAEIVKAGHSVLVLEARDRIGGRTHTYTDDKLGIPMDCGGSFIHGLAGNPLKKLADRDNLKLFVPGSSGPPEPKFAQIWSSEGPPLPSQLAERLSHNSMRTIFSTSVDFAQENSNSVPDEAESLGSYILDEKRSTLFEGLETEQEKQCAVQMQASWDGWTGADLKNISLKYWQSDVTFEGGDATIVDGYKGIYEPLAASIRQHSSSDIKLNSEVVSIAYDQDSETVTVQTKDANDEDETASATATYTASYVVCTLPLGVLQNRPPKFSPPLSARRAQALNRLQMGLLNKVMITYTNCFWPPTQTFLSFLPSPASRAFLPNLQNRALFAQNYKPITGKNTLVFYIGGDTGAELEDLTDEEAKEKLHAVLKHHFGHEETFPAKDDEGPIAFTVTRWLKDPYSQGAYSYIRPAKEGEKDVPTPYDYAELSRPAWDRRLFFAGEGTDPDHYATVHGALITGIRQAVSLLSSMQAKQLEA